MFQPPHSLEPMATALRFGVKLDISKLVQSTWYCVYYDSEAHILSSIESTGSGLDEFGYGTYCKSTAFKVVLVLTVIAVHIKYVLVAKIDSFHFCLSGAGQPVALWKSSS